MDAIQQNLNWIKSGKMGCTFAAYFAGCPEKIGWQFVVNPKSFSIPKDCLMLSLIFPQSDKASVKEWALNNGFYLENISDGLSGLRYKCKEGIAWVQYFGQDANVETRQTPYPMLTLCVKLPAKQYIKVGFKGVLHIAHACVSGLSDYVANRLWDTSFTNTEKRLGRKPTIKEAAKTTYHD